MALFDPAALKTGVRVREVWGWALFDAANSGYSTVILTAVFNTYFVSVICGSADWATFLWTAVVAASNILCLILMPAFRGQPTSVPRKSAGALSQRFAALRPRPF